MQGDFSNILIRGLNWIGDAVMATPAVMAVRNRFPAARITMLANRMVGELMQNHPAVDHVITFVRAGGVKGVADRIRLATKLKKERFDLCIILPNSFDSALVPWLAGIPQRWGKASDGRSMLLTRRFHDKGTETGHELYYYLQLLDSFGIGQVAAEPLLVTTGDEDRAAASLLAQHGITADDLLIGINAGASFGSAKRWYPERFAQVAAQLSVALGGKVILFGGSGERDIVAAIDTALAGNCLNMAGNTTVRQLMALIRRCNIFITNDSGPMHIAAAFHVPLVAIFGPTDHTGTAPFSDLSVVVRHDTDCAPCKLRHCPTDHRCMKAVTAEQVVEAAIELWNRRNELLAKVAKNVIPA